MDSGTKSTLGKFMILTFSVNTRRIEVLFLVCMYVSCGYVRSGVMVRNLFIT